MNALCLRPQESRVLVTQQAHSSDLHRQQLLEELLEHQGFQAAQTQWGAMLALYGQGEMHCHSLLTGMKAHAC